MRLASLAVASDSTITSNRRLGERRLQNGREATIELVMDYTVVNTEGEVPPVVSPTFLTNLIQSDPVAYETTFGQVAQVRDSESRNRVSGEQSEELKSNITSILPNDINIISLSFCSSQQQGVPELQPPSSIESVGATSTNAEAPSQTSTGGGLSTGGIAGIVVGSVAFLGLLGIGANELRKKRNRDQSDSESNLDELQEYNDTKKQRSNPMKEFEVALAKPEDIDFVTSLDR